MDSGSLSAIHTNIVVSKVAATSIPSSYETPVNDGLLRPRSVVYSSDASAEVRNQTLPHTNNIVSISSINIDESIQEGFWATAMAEVESNERRPGLWAKAFAEADGDEIKANAAYIKARFQQMLGVAQAEASQQRNKDAKTKALALELAKIEEIDEVMADFSLDCLDNNGSARWGTISEPQLKLLIKRKNISTIVNKRDSIKRNTLLHMCAEYGMLDEVRALLVAGANPNQSNAQGMLPFHMTKNKDVRWLLDEGYKYLTPNK